MKTLYLTQNSTYEFDDEAMRLRRVEGDNPPTANTGTDGEWKDVQGVHRVGADHSRLWIVWSDGTSTVTSPVIAELRSE